MRRYSTLNTEACTGSLYDSFFGGSSDSAFEIIIEDGNSRRGRAHPLDMAFKDLSDFGASIPMGRGRKTKKNNPNREKQRAAKAARKRNRMVRP